MEVPGGGFSIRVEAARTEFNEEGALSEYLSDVTVIEDGVPVREHRIEVNHPLVHNGIGVYQFEMLPAADSVREVLLGVIVPRPDEAPLHLEVPAVPRERVEIPETSLSVEVLEFLSDFTYDIETKTAGLASPRHDNPAVFVQVWDGDDLVGEQWVFAGAPGHESQGAPCRLFFLDYIPDFDHGLTRFEFTRQPGTPLLFIGFATLSLGLCLVFWTRKAPPLPSEVTDGTES